jgi:hypothetical protein
MHVTIFWNDYFQPIKYILILQNFHFLSRGLNWYPLTYGDPWVFFWLDLLGLFSVTLGYQINSSTQRINFTPFAVETFIETYESFDNL